LEPDKRCPDSQPLDVEIALEVLLAAGTVDRPMVDAACDWLASVADERGGVPIAFPSIAAYPRAPHWGDEYRPDLNPTAGLVGRLRALGVEHAWIERATEFCW